LERGDCSLNKFEVERNCLVRIDTRGNELGDFDKKEMQLVPLENKLALSTKKKVDYHGNSK